MYSLCLCLRLQSLSPLALERNMPPTQSGQVDVFVVGAGPVGLFAALSLVRLGLSVRICDILAEPSKAGKADAVNPRSLEVFDQLDLLDELLATGGKYTRNVHIFRNGKKFQTLPVVNPHGSEFSFMYNIGQQFIEGVLMRELEKRGVQVERPVTPVDFEIDEDALSKSEHAVTVTVQNLFTEAIEHVKTKYVIAADGAHSFVRKKLGVVFKGDNTDMTWGVLDTEVTKTDFPLGKDFNLVHGEKGSGMIVNRELGITRIYINLNPKNDQPIDRKQVTLEYIQNKSKIALYPFEFEYGNVEWWSLYVVGQYVADQFIYKNRIFFAGDSAHSHSPSSAQGLNIGLADAWNLAWKMYWVERRYAHPSLLSTYELERKMIAEKVINDDKKLAALSGQRNITSASPDSNTDIQKEYIAIREKRQDFNGGTGVEYDPSWLNLCDSSTPAFLNKFEVRAGQRAPDAHLVHRGDPSKKRLFDAFSKTGQFNILVFAGDINITRATLENLYRHFYSNDTVFARISSEANADIEKLFKLLVITTTTDHAILETLTLPGGSATDKVVLIDETDCHTKYGIVTDEGAVVVVRPDGWIGCTVLLKDYNALEEYFHRLGNFGR